MIFHVFFSDRFSDNWRIFLPEDVRLITPENIEIRFYLAGLCTRGKAFFYDGFYQLLIAVGVTIVTYEFLGGYSSPFRFFAPAIAMGLNFLVFWGYHILFEVFMDGQTPGKRQFGIRVVTLDGQKIEFFPSLVRNLLRIVDFLPFGFLTGCVALMTTKNHQRLGDLFSRTMVIRETQLENLPPNLFLNPPTSKPGLDSNLKVKLDKTIVFHGRKRV